MKKLCELSDVLVYENTSVVHRFCFENPDKSVEQAQQIFQDLLSWLWLGVHREKRKLTTHMIAPLVMLDKVWHVFILHTQAYTEFCQHYFGKYLHHQVELVGAEYTMSADELSLFLSDCYDHLGEDWLIRNF